MDARTSEDLLFSPIDEVQALYKEKEVSPLEVLEATLRRLEELEPRLNAFVTVMAEEAREQAREAEKLYSRDEATGRLLGIPVSVKDIFATRGIRTTVGSRILKDSVPDYDARVYRDLRGAGAVVFGKNNMLEFAYGFVHPDYGQCNNPWDTNRTAGGSSSGSASSVAAGIGYASIGTDTGGSIRIPASFCGVVGLKPTYEKVSRDGCFPLSHTLDHVGPITRTVRDNAAVLEAISDTDGAIPPTGSLSGVRIGVIENLMGEPIDPEVLSLVEAATERLRGLGGEVTNVRVPGVEAASDTALPILLPEASYHHGEWYPDRADDYSSGTRANIDAGFKVPAVEYVRALQERRRLTATVNDALGRVDVLVCPTVAYTATVTDPNFEGGAEEYILRSIPFDVTGHPALTIPVGNTSFRNLPAGLELISAHHAEATAYRVAAAYEDDLGGFARPPL
ncbi:MAG: amidase [Actinobacteria bacterium]|nr:MAG: amidase [Actinomycetota bacterium]